MSVHTVRVSVTASSVQTVSFGKHYTNVAFYLQSGTSSGAIKVAVSGPGGDNYINPSPNRIPLDAGVNPYKVIDLAMGGCKLTSSGTASLTVLLITAWDEAT